MKFGLPRHHYRLIDSTNERARRLAAAGAPGGMVITAGEQSAGRGRQGRGWSAPAGKALLCSAILRPLTERHKLLPLAVPVAVCEAAEALAPVVAHLAAGAKLGEAGEPIEVESLSRLDLPQPRLYPDRVVAHVLYVDGFGNIALNIDHQGLAETFLRLGHKVAVDTGRARVTVPFARAFADVSAGQGLLYEDSSRSLALAVNRDSAAELLELRPDDEVVLTPA